MVRTIDGDARRRALAEAVWRLLEREGIEAASVRRVAAESRLSIGSVRHFFGTQSALHVFAMQALTQRVSERIDAVAHDPDARRRALAMVAELVPLREDTTRELRIWWEFVGLARHEPALRAVLMDQATQIRSFLRRVVVGLIESGLLADGVDIDLHVARLGVLVDGLTFQLVITPGVLDVTTATTMLENELFTGVPSQIGQR